jgi:hypothetical protein
VLLAHDRRQPLLELAEQLAEPAVTVAVRMLRAEPRPASNRNGGRLQFGTLAGFTSEYPAGFDRNPPHDRRLVRGGGLVPHRDRRVQYASIRCTERLAEAGIEPSVGIGPLI